MIKKIKDYAKRLCEEDAKIEEIVLIGSFANGTATKKSDVDLICVFTNELESKWEGDDLPEELKTVMGVFERVYALKRKLSPLERKIGRFIDLGFITENGDIFVGGGLISKYAGKYKTLVKRSEINHKKKELTKNESLSNTI